MQLKTPNSLCLSTFVLKCLGRTYLENVHLGVRVGVALLADNEHKDVVVDFHRVIAHKRSRLLDQRCWESLHHLLQHMPIIS